MRRLAVLLCLALVTVVPHAGEASCAAPSISVMPHERRAGKLVLVTGTAWEGPCDDTGGACAGCGDCSIEDEEEAVVEVDEVVLEISRPGMAPVELATVDVDGSAALAEEVRLPRSLEPGRYRITARARPAGGRVWTRLLVVD